MFLKRDMEKTLGKYIDFPVIAILGPRQSGKTTLAKQWFDKHIFISFEDHAIREFANSDPRGFLNEYKSEHGIILDEFQYVPQILSYIQLEVDAKNRPSYFVITGSQNFLMNQAITQSLAGRVGILTLLPFSIHELFSNDILPERAFDLILKGSYPRAYTSNIPIQDLYASYIQTYVERDVRQLINVGDLQTFQKFVMLCAGRIGQLLNLTDIAVSCGISSPTATKWLSVLEASYILFRLPTYFNNFNKRLVKTPKLYFYDTGLACKLLSINSTETLLASPFRGPLFENLIIADLNKQFYNKGKTPTTYFWRDANDRVEVDCIIDKGNKLVLIEIKASETISSSFFSAMLKWNQLSDTTFENNYVVYAGETNQKRTHGQIISWSTAGNLIDKLQSKP